MAHTKQMILSKLEFQFELESSIPWEKRRYSIGFEILDSGIFGG